MTETAHARLNLRVARLSVITALSLGVLKLLAVVFTGSLAIAASLTDSLMDLVASSVNYVAVHFAGQPADEDHRYGHGKAEGLAGLGQGLLIGFAGLFLLVEGIRRIATPTDEITRTEVGIAVMAVSMAASAWIGWLLLRTSRKTGSIALKADAAHYTADVWMNGGVLLALILVRTTGWVWIDGAISVLVALFVLYACARVLRHAVNELMDVRLEDDEEARIRAHIEEAVPETRNLHRLRTRRSGPSVFVDLHVAFDRNLSFPDAHRLSERVRHAVEEAVPGAQVHVHADPDPYYESDRG